MNAPRFSSSIEYPAAARRAGLAAVLLCSFGYYAARKEAPAEPAAASRAAVDVAAPRGRHVMVYTAGHDAPREEGGLADRIGRLLDRALGRTPAAGEGLVASRPEDFAAALSGRADPSALPPDAAQAARDAKAVGDLLGQLGIPSLGTDVLVITDKQPPPLDEKTKQALLEEAAAGVAGPTINRLIDEAEKAGALDLPLYGGRSMRQIRDHAKALGAKADAMAEQRRKEQAEEMGLPPGADEPAVVVPQLLKMLQGSDEDKADAAQQFCDVRFARWPAAADAIPQLEAMERSGKPEFEFAQLALKRLRHFKAKRDFDAKLR